jgi:hypothetical protein
LLLITSTCYRPSSAYVRKAAPLWKVSRHPLHKGCRSPKATRWVFFASLQQAYDDVTYARLIDFLRILDRHHPIVWYLVAFETKIRLSSKFRAPHILVPHHHPASSRLDSIEFRPKPTVRRWSHSSLEQEVAPKTSSYIRQGRPALSVPLISWVLHNS